MGFSVITGDPFGTVMHADNASFDGTKRGAVLDTDGQLWIGSGVSPRVKKGSITSPDGSVTIGYSSPNITLAAGATVATIYQADVGSATPAANILNVFSVGEASTTGSGNTLGVKAPRVAKFVVDPNVNNGTNQTIQSAIDAATSGDTIFIRPGTYTENLTLKAGVNLCAFECDPKTPNVTISGTCTFTQAGTVALSGLRLQTNGSFALAVTGSAASIVRVVECYINCTNNTGISFTSSSSSAEIWLQYCETDLTATGIALFSKSSPGALRFFYVTCGNSGGSTTANTISAGGFFPFACSISNPTTTSGATAVISGGFNQFATNAQNVTALTCGSTSASGHGIFNSEIFSGSASAVSIGAGAIASLDMAGINSTNTNVLTGAGTLNFGQIIFNGSSSGVNVTTQTPLKTMGGGWSRIKTLTASASATLDFTDLPSYTTYALVLNNLLPATNAQQLILRVSNNNGSSFSAVGYNAGVNYTSYNSATVTNVNSTTGAPLTSNSGNGVGISGTVFVNFGNGFYHGQTAYGSTDSGLNAFGNCGGATGLQPNAFRLLMSSGNLTSGNVTLFGLNA
jgi:hypothetical protein